VTGGPKVPKKILSGGPIAALLDELRAAYPGWTITARPAGLSLWTAERHEGTALRYIVAPTGGELAAKLESADAETASEGSTS